MYWRLCPPRYTRGEPPTGHSGRAGGAGGRASKGAEAGGGSGGETKEEEEEDTHQVKAFAILSFPHADGDREKTTWIDNSTQPKQKKLSEMSVCLAVTKTIAVSSLGLYCGILSTTTTVALVTPLDVLVTHFKKPFKRVVGLSGVLAGLSSVFFAVSYFGAPVAWRHPYLLYGMCVGPLSVGYLAGVTVLSRCRCQRRREAAADATVAGEPLDVVAAAAAAAATDDDDDAELGESLVDLGDSEHHDKSPQAASQHQDITPQRGECAEKRGSARGIQSTMVFQLCLLTGVSLLGYVQSVVGVHGEGLFA